MAQPYPESTARGGRMPRSARRAQLMEAAQSVFVEAGYHGAAMDEIAERAHVSKPVLYQHFPGKLDLYLALLDHHTKQVPELVDAALKSTEHNPDRVSAAMSAFFEFVEHKDAAFRLVFESDLINEPAVAAKVERMSTLCAESIAVVIREDTGLDEERSMLLGVALVGMAQVVARWWVSQENRIPREQAEQMVTVLGWRGIAGFPKND